MPRVSTDNIETHYVRQGSGEPLILIHSFTASFSTWEKQIPVFSREYDVVAYDVRGHGDSTHPCEDLDMRTLVRDLLLLMESLKIASAHLAGVSMGGMIVERFALEHPERVISMVLADTFPGKLPDQVMHTFLQHRNLVKKAGLEKLFEHVMVHPALPAGPDSRANLEDMDKLYHEFMKNDPVSLAAFVDLFERLPDWTRDLSMLAAPVLLIAGELDEPCLGPMERMQKAIPDPEFHVLPDCGHLSVEEKPELFNRLALDFLKRHPLR